MPQEINSTNRNIAADDADFSIPITDETDLGVAMLIAETEDGAYEPVSSVSTVAEAREIAGFDLGIRIRANEGGQETLCPAVYAVWARGVSGCYHVAAHIEPARLWVLLAP